MDKQSIARNSTYLLAASIIQKILNLVYFVLIARSFGPADQGKYSTALAFAALFSVAVDFGAAAVLTREIARDTSKASQYLSHILCFRIVVGIITYGVIIAAASLIGYSGELQFLIALASISMVLDMVSTAVWAVFRGFQNFKYEGRAIIGTNLVMVLGGCAFIFLKAPLYSLVAILIAASFANVLYGFFLLATKYHIKLQFKITWPTLKSILLLALPFAGAAVFSRIYTNTDLVLLSRLSSEFSVGWYSAANKAILALQFIPAAITSALYPAMSQYWQREPARVGELFSRTCVLLLLFVLPIASGLALLAEPIVSLFYGSQYGPSVGTLQILSSALIFAFLIFPLGVLIAATNRQLANTAVLAGAALVNVVGNWICIPLFGLSGAAWISVVTYGGIFLVEMIITRNYWRAQRLFLVTKFLQILFATGCMVLVVYFLKPVSSLPITILLGAVVYFLCIILVRAFPKRELQGFMQVFSKKNETSEK